MLFIIGCVIEVTFCILSLFVATFYSQDWGYAKVFKENAVSLGNKDGWTLLGQYGVIYGFLIGVVILTAIIYLICFLTKNENIIPRFVIGIVFVAPIVFLIVAISNAVQNGQFKSIGFIMIGAGVNSGLTIFGLLFCVASIISFTFVCIGLKKRKEKQFKNPEKKVKEIKVKNISSNDIKSEDWKL